MIWITVILIALVVIGVFLARADYDLLSAAFLIPGGALLVIVAIGWPAQYFTEKSNIQQYYITKQTIAVERQSNTSDVERAALVNKIIETNNWLASAKYTRHTIFRDIEPDEIDSLDYLK